MDPLIDRESAMEGMERWGGGPGGGWWAIVFGGIAVPLVLVGYGVSCIAMRRAWLFGHEVSLPVSGSEATSVGIAAITAGLFLHSHYFCGNLALLARWSWIGKVVGAIGFILGLGYVVVRLGVDL